MTLEPTLTKESQQLYTYILSLLKKRLQATPDRLLRALCDGKDHSTLSLAEYLPDNLGGKRNIKTHMCTIRKELEAFGLTVVCELRYRRVNYRLVRLLSDALQERFTLRGKTERD